MPLVGHPAANKIDALLLNLAVKHDFLGNQRASSDLISKALLGAQPEMQRAPSLSAMKARIFKLLEPHKTGATYSREVVSTGNEAEGEGADDLTRAKRDAAEYIAKKFARAQLGADVRRAAEAKDAANTAQEAAYSCYTLEKFAKGHEAFEKQKRTNDGDEGTSIFVT